MAETYAHIPIASFCSTSILAMVFCRLKGICWEYPKNIVGIY